MSYRKQKKLSLLPTRSDGLASFLLISFHRCCPLSFGEAHFCRRRRSQKAITTDQRGFAGVRPPHHAASSGEHSLTGVELAGAVCLPTSGALVGADDFLRLRFFRLFFLDYFDATGHYNGTINYKLTGSTHNPKDACQIRFAAWERRGLSSNKGKHRCDEVVSSSVMIFGTIDFFARIYSNNQPI